MLILRYLSLILSTTSFKCLSNRSSKSHPQPGGGGGGGEGGGGAVFLKF